MDIEPTFISSIHSYIRSTRATRRGARVRPNDAPVGLHKEYLRMPRIPLPAAENLAMSLGAAMDTRASSMNCNADRALSLSELGTLLGHALGMRAGLSRHYPSGGGMYPIETYLIGAVLEDHSPGVFHYHPKAHALEQLWDVPADFRMGDVLRAANVPLAPILVVFTSVWDRSAIKYGDFAYSHGLLEAGHMAQNILLAATAMNIGARPVSGCDDAVVNDLLDLDGFSEQPVYSITLCPPRAA